MRESDAILVEQQAKQQQGYNVSLSGTQVKMQQ